MLNQNRRLLPLLGAVLLLAACGGEGGEKAAATGQAAAGDSAGADTSAGGGVSAPAPARGAEDNGPKTDLTPNELGEIMVLEYHRLGNNEGEFVRRADNFRKDLQTLYEKGYRPVTMRQVIEGNIDIPAGTTPVVFTIDDSSLGQFYYLPDGRIDPNTMMGMWAAFKERNPGWRNGAVWCVLPAAGHPSNFFSEKPDREIPRAQREANIRKKIDYLVQNGHEVCNHTLYHARLDRARDDAQVQEWIGRGEDSIKVYLPPDYDIVTFALPLGMWPRNRALAWRGSWNGKPYENRVVLEVSGGPNVSPWDRAFDPHSVDRFIVAPNHLERQLAAYERNPSRRYVSDGDPNTVAYPQREASRLDRGKLRGKTVRVVPDQPTGAQPAGGQPAAGGGR
ncbi:MAG TPA: hypothetical protein VHG28_20290 [Longimicrobiaceae bacterium]|nr:hypothetical protein [Longimicrobiaceae bacterium]